MRTPDTPLDFELEPRRQFTCGVYFIKCSVSGKMYIGSSFDVMLRLYQHRYSLRIGDHHNAHLQYAWNLYGEKAFEFKPLRVGFGELIDARKFEGFLIPLFGSYNIASVDVNGSPRPSVQTRAKMAEARRRQPPHSEETRAKISAGNRGKKQPKPSTETRVKMSLAHLGKPGTMKGRKHTEESLVKMRVPRTKKMSAEECLLKSERMKLIWEERRHARQG